MSNDQFDDGSAPTPFDDTGAAFDLYMNSLFNEGRAQFARHLPVEAGLYCDRESAGGGQARKVVGDGRGRASASQPILVTVQDNDPAIADRLTRQLRTELLGLDVGDAFSPRRSTGEGARPGAVTTFIVVLAGSPVLKQFSRVLMDFVNRDRDREIIIKRGKDTHDQGHVR
ncbi:hypothetical protein [Actinocrispum sp. NPDC049592]|uniref:hypothetical protein n=1 Tax=Actinocrispum sp. NPDC049592 TaxID=3154835 RepID=UPI00341D3AA5